jgi:hypothetical protein
MSKCAQSLHFAAAVSSSAQRRNWLMSRPGTQIVERIEPRAVFSFDRHHHHTPV